MKVTVMGINYNHLLSGKELVEMGNEVIYISNDYKRIANIKRGYYNADEAMVIKNMKNQDNVGFSTDLKKSLSETNMCFISEGDRTNEIEDVLQTAKLVGEHMTHHMFIIDRSEGSSSRASQIKATIEEELAKRDESLTFEVIANPDFLRA